MGPDVSDSEVRTKLGVIRGTADADTDSYLGIPYGRIPGRFRHPLPIDSYSSPIDATRLGPQSVQNNPDYPAWQDPSPEAEDCLVLNVWRPRSSRQGPLPVMVWVHGGAYAYGSAGVGIYNGSALAAGGDVVVVSMNHRLNAFGYLWLGDLIPELAAHPNPGQQDLLVALRWIADNIAAFGGDPSNVTLFGESGGGGKISTLLGTPAAAGLFHKVAIQSGPHTVLADRQHATGIGRRFAELLGVRPDDLAALKSKPVAELKTAAEALTAEFGILAFQPVVDGVQVPVQPWADGQPDLVKALPLLTGITRDETVLFLPEAMSNGVDSDEGVVEGLLGFLVPPPLDHDRAAALVGEYRALQPDLAPRDLLLMLTRDTWMWRGMLGQLDARMRDADEGASTFAYDFRWATPCFNGRWAVHAGELPFLFGTLDHDVAWDGSDSADQRAKDDPTGRRFDLSRTMISAWSGFAWTGDPSTAEVPWPRYDSNKRATLLLDRSGVTVAEDPDAARRVLLEPLPLSW